MIDVLLLRLMINRVGLKEESSGSEILSNLISG